MARELPPTLVVANREFARAHPGESGARQPVHTMYGGAHLYNWNVCRKMGALAQRALAEYAPDAATLALATGIPNRLADVVYERLLEKLLRQPVEDFHVDFEDGYGFRPDAEEDAAADRCAEEMAKSMEEDSLPPFVGIRIKPLNQECSARAVRTLRRFLTALLKKTGGHLPKNFSVTLPKITISEQVSALAALLDEFGVVHIELMIETPQALLLLPRLIDAARGRAVAAHFGPYDYTSNVGIVRQDVLHPACDFARAMMQAQAAGLGLRLADGPTNVMPVRIFRGDSISPAQAAENRAAVHRGWKLHYEHIQHALGFGFYQGWDLHPAQLVSRFAAVYAFFLDGLDLASERLKNFVAQAAQATMVAGIFDDAAMGQALLNYFLRAIECGAIPESDASSLTGLSMEELRSRSFAKISAQRGPATSKSKPNLIPRTIGSAGDTIA